MNTHYHAIVWIDHHEAKVFFFDDNDVQAERIRSTNPHVHLHHHANAGDSGHVGTDKAFLKRVAAALGTAGAILITGPAGAKKELQAYIEQEAPLLFPRISDVQTLSHTSDGALIALARRFFKADDRMHSQADGPRQA